MTGTDNLRARATSGIGWMVVERWGSRFLSLIVLVILTRALNPEDFGLISIAAAFIAVLQVFVDSGFSKALIQKAHLAPKDASTAFWSSLAISALLGTALLASAPTIAEMLGEARLEPVLQVLSLALPIIALSQTPAALLEREFHFRALSIRQLVGVLAGSAVAVLLAFAGAGVWALVAQTLVASTVSVITLWASTSWRPRFEFSIVSLRNLGSVGVTVLGIELLDAIQANIDKLVIGVFFTAEQLGYYFLAQRIGTILIELVTSVISRVSFTTFSRVQHDLVRLNRIFNQLTFAACAVSIPVFALVALLAPQIVPFLFGDNWDESIPLMWILAPGWALGAVMYFDRTVLLATRHTKAALGLALAQNIVGIAMVFAFIPFGVAGIAFSRLSRVVTWPARLLVLRHTISLKIWAYLLQTLRCLAAIAPPAVMVALLQLTDWSRAPGAVWTFAAPLTIVTVIIYAVLLWSFAGDQNRRVLTDIRREVMVRVRRSKPAEVLT